MPFPLPACTDMQVRVCNQFKRISLSYEVDVENDNVILARVEGDQIPLGTYAIEVKGKIFGNDWRSNEYPQFSIVAKNADADTEFGETDDGDNSVEMDTAMVILPPTVELSDLINKANDALKTNKETNDTLNANESARKEAEAQRVTAESERVSAEQSRESAEEARVSAEGDRANAERDRALAEFNRIEAERVRVENENTILANERTRNDNEHERVNAEIMREHAEEERVTAENSRANSEVQRVSAENERDFAENGRASAEAERVQAEKKRQNDTSVAIGSMTERINAAIDEFNAHRTEFDEAEAHRVDAENSRVEAETARANAEKSRVTSENERVSAETDRAEAESNRQAASAKAVKAANDAAAQANATNESIKTNEQGRVDAETNRKSAEKSRNDKEGIRQESENERISQETERQTNEQKRVEAENKRIKAEADRVSAEDARAEAEQARVGAETKRERDFDTAIKAAETATTGAETCNVELSGSTISVTNRNGETKSVDVINTDEEVTVTITSSVESISVAGIKINVFLNNGKTPQTYTTDSEGKTTFKVSRGVYYQVAVPEYANAQPLSPIGFTSVGVSKTITFNYEPYDEETSEKVIVTVTKYTDGNGTPWEGKEVIVTIDNKATTYTTDGKGQATIYVPYLKEYTVRVDDEEGYYVRFNKNSRTYISRVAQRLIQVNMYQFKTGIYVLDSDATEYYIEDWVAAGKSAEEAVAIKVADQNLRLNRGTFVIRCNDLKDMTKLQKYQWCTQNLQFTSIALNGNTSSDPNYWNGEQSSFLVRQEAEERSLSVPAFAFAYGQSLEIGGEKLNGFLMSVGQEYVHISNAGTIREVLRTLFGDSVADAYYKFVNEQLRWTSTQSNATGAWFFSSQAYNDYYKYSSYYVLPVFAC